MAWWDQLDKDRFLQFHQEALRERPDPFTPDNPCAAAHIISSKVWFPFTTTLNDYAAFLALSTAYLESDRTGAPIESYTLGTTVLMWHAAIWEYIGQSINMLCDWIEDERKVSFESATEPQMILGIDEARLMPIPKASLEELAARLRSIWGSTSVPRKIRNIGAHRYHIANTYSQEFADLIKMKGRELHRERLRRLQDNIKRSFNALIKAQTELQTFLKTDSVRRWNRPWYQIKETEN